MNVYYPPPNLSNLVTRTETGQFASNSELQATGIYLFNLIGTISGGGNTGDNSLLTGASGTLQSQINSIANNSGYLTNSTANSLFVHLTGNESISGEKTFRLIQVANSNNEGLTVNLDGISGSYSTFTGAGYSISLLEGTLNDLADKVKLDWNQNILSGEWFSNGTGENANSIVTFSKLTDLSGVLINSLPSGSSIFRLNNLTGNVELTGAGSISVIQNGQVITVSGSNSSLPVDLSGYITTGQADLRFVHLTGSETISGVKTFRNELLLSAPAIPFLRLFSDDNVRATSLSTDEITDDINSVPIVDLLNGKLYNRSTFLPALDWTSLTLSGNWTTNASSSTSGTIINYFRLTGMSGFLRNSISSTGSDLYNLITGLSGASTTGNYLTRPETGQFYPASNPQSYAQSGFVTNLSGYLISQINASSAGVSILNGLTGIINILGTGGLTVTSSSQQIFISGSDQIVNLSGYIKTGDSDLRYYPLHTNPSGYIRNADFFTGSETNFIIDIPTGNNLYYINFGLNFNSIPRIFLNQVSDDDIFYSYKSKNVTTSGFNLLLSDIVYETGLKFNILAKNRTGVNL